MEIIFREAEERAWPVPMTDDADTAKRIFNRRTCLFLRKHRAKENKNNFSNLKFPLSCHFSRKITLTLQFF